MNKEIEYYEFRYKIPKYKIKPPLDFCKYYEIHKDEIIIDLHQENKQLKAKLEMYENGVYYSSENDKYKEVIEEVREYILNHELVEEKDHYVLNGNELLQILDKAKN